MFLIFSFDQPANCSSQAKKDLSSHCDQIVMSLASLNKQRGNEKLAQSIKTTVTISSVSKTPLGSNTPVMTHTTRIISDGTSEKSEPSIASSDSLQTVRELSKSPEDIPFADEVIGYRSEQAKRAFLNDGAEMSRRGEFCG